MKPKKSQKGGGGVGGKKKNGKSGGAKNNMGLGNKNKKPGTAKSKASSKGEWNFVPVGEEYFTDKEFENLVSFEELADYDVVVNADGTKEILSGGGDKGKKRKVEEVEYEMDDDEVIENSEEVEETEERKVKASAAKKQKTKDKKRNVGGKEESGDDGVINTSAGSVIVEESEEVEDKAEERVEVKKKEKRKDKKKVDKVSKVKDDGKKNERGNYNKQNKIELVQESEDDEVEDNQDFEKQEWMKLGVPEIILKSLKEKEFNKPTTIQSLTLPATILGKKDVVGAAETGSGKTLAFAIPIIYGILNEGESADKVSVEEHDSSDDEAEKGQSLKALILTPTRELAVQIKNHFDVAAKYTNIKTVVIVGGLATQKQERLLRTRPDVVIATPGRLWELVQEGDPHLSTLNKIRYLAIDETDRMVEKGHFQELEGILNVLNKDEALKERRQNFIFSATLAFTHEPPQRLNKIGNKKMKQPKKLSAKDKLKLIMDMVGVRPNPKIVDITTSKGTCETLTEMQISCSQDHKDYYLYYFLVSNPGRTIVFCNSINCVRRLTNLFFLLKCGEVLPLHSEMHQKQRLRNLERFTENEKGILIATDVAARGLDIQNIQHVIHYQVPKTAESYIHRSGRTARAFKGGQAILMIEPGETTTVRNIFQSLGRDEMLPDFDVDGKMFRETKSRVEMAVKVEQFEHRVRKKLADHNWMEKAKEEMDLASSEEESDDDGDGIGSQKKMLMKAKKQLDSYKQQLARMLSKNT